MSTKLEQGMSHFREALASVLEEVVEFPRGTIVTVRDVKLTRNLAHAKCILSVYPTGMEDEVRHILAIRNRDIKTGIAKSLRLRKIPDFFWAFDEVESEASEIDRLLNELKMKGEL